MCQVHTGAYVSLLAPGKTDYTASNYEYSYRIRNCFFFLHVFLFLFYGCSTYYFVSFSFFFLLFLFFSLQNSLVCWFTSLFARMFTAAKCSPMHGQISFLYLQCVRGLRVGQGSTSTCSTQYSIDRVKTVTTQHAVYVCV